MGGPPPLGSCCQRLTQARWDTPVLARAWNPTNWRSSRDRPRQNPHEAFQKQLGTATAQEASEGEGAYTGCWGPVACKERSGGEAVNRAEVMR